jgi:hypothetical protein
MSKETKRNGLNTVDPDGEYVKKKRNMGESGEKGIFGFLGFGDDSRARSMRDRVGWRRKRDENGVRNRFCLNGV